MLDVQTLGGGSTSAEVRRLMEKTGEAVLYIFTLLGQTVAACRALRFLLTPELHHLCTASNQSINAASKSPPSQTSVVRTVTCSLSSHQVCEGLKRQGS